MARWSRWYDSRFGCERSRVLFPEQPWFCIGCWPLVSRIGLCNAVCKLRTYRVQIAHAGSRNRVTSIGGLYDTATLRALSSAVLLVVFVVCVVMVVVIVLVLCVVLASCSTCCCGCGVGRLCCNWQIARFVVSSYCRIGRAPPANIAPTVGLEPTTTRLRASRSTDWARRALCNIKTDN